VAFAASAVGPLTASAQEASRCRGASEEPPVTPRSGRTQSRLQEKSVRFAFDGERDRSDRTIGIDASPKLPANATVFAEVSGDLERSDGGDTFPVEAIVVQTTTTRSRDVRLQICLDPQRPENVEPGRYVGSVKLTGEQIEPTAITVEATLRRRSLTAIVVLITGIVLGLLMKAFGDKQLAEAAVRDARATVKPAGESVPADSSVKKKKLEFWRSYASGGQFVTGLVLGLILAALAYAQIYATDPDWGTPLDIVTLGLAGVAAVVSGKTVVDVVAPFVPTMPK